eukprot:TRINITY_DN2498_c0_g1_i1.p3 TRINITY_DN2498_c0_g1~~TRINITY_DN2498_c0_g1_i1.p3  ORF type:complete len:122 (-),score=14.74 TRINITY_DN2498_c0_g1_i1:118-483(-)
MCIRDRRRVHEKSILLEELGFEIYKPEQLISNTYEVDYMHGNQHLIMILGPENYLVGSVRELGPSLLRKRHLISKEYKLHVIEYPVIKSFERKHQKVAYINKVMKGVPRRESFMSQESFSY